MAGNRPFFEKKFQFQHLLNSLAHARRMMHVVTVNAMHRVLLNTTLPAAQRWQSSRLKLLVAVYG
jgi:hypothetical protein